MSCIVLCQVTLNNGVGYKVIRLLPVDKSDYQYTDYNDIILRSIYIITSNKIVLESVLRLRYYAVFPAEQV